jgi:hypothetical protein
LRIDLYTLKGSLRGVFKRGSILDEEDRGLQLPGDPHWDEGANRRYNIMKTMLMRAYVDSRVVGRAMV